MRLMKKVYPTFISQNGKDYLVYVPDMDIYTEGKSMEDAIDMARDAIGLKGIDYENDGKELPEPSDDEGALQKAKEDTDIYDYSKGIQTLVDIDFAEYRRRMDNKMVRRNVTLPSWMDAAAEKEKINVSKVLQEALASRLDLHAIK